MAPDKLPDRFQEQFDQIQDAMGEKVVLAAGFEGSQPMYLYQKGYVLARAEEAGEVADTIQKAFSRDRGGSQTGNVKVEEEKSPGGVLRIRVGEPDRSERYGDRDVSDALKAVEHLERDRNRRMVSRNHIVSIAVNCCPGDEPVPVARCEPPNPAVAKSSGQGSVPVSVLVVDTGLVENYKSHPWMHRVKGDGKEIELDEEGILKQYVGHGTFIAGLVSAVAPDTDVTVHGTLVNAGAICEKDLGDKLLGGMLPTGKWPDIISLSAGTTSMHSETLLGLERFMNALMTHPETLLVAAAGNNGNDVRFWPAAYSDHPGYAGAVVSVGALRKDGADRACFSNHGPWVTTYAPGERLVSAFTAVDPTPAAYDYQHSTFPHCRYGFHYDCTCQFPPHRGELTEKMEKSPTAIRDRVVFDGLAEWSGTSFSTPLVAGMIANYMMLNKGIGSREAARKLLDETPIGILQSIPTPALIPTTWTPQSVQSVPVTR
ncbi:S8/S53 family peptidase [Streptosporangium sp. NBC_01495]|uniref:S8/S53 family peptidase n=1 Tax=Streptosporangium sp. NBC_01495 TaxID=2903899 RepID=UPI002E323327|nr:S8/S53 family peptidase [Streptosporangium sp. NBC_01495]